MPGLPGAHLEVAVTDDQKTIFDSVASTRTFYARLRERHREHQRRPRECQCGNQFDARETGVKSAEGEWFCSIVCLNDNHQ